MAWEIWERVDVKTYNFVTTQTLEKRPIVCCDNHGLLVTHVRPE